MTLSKQPYNYFGAVKITFQLTPLYTLLYVVLSIVQAVMPTAAMALATANFIDTVTVIIQGYRPREDIYLSLALLLLVLCVHTGIGSIIQLISVRIHLTLQQKLKPEIVRVHAALNYKLIEDAQSWELISRVSRDPVKSVMDGFNAFIQFMQIIMSLASVLVLIIAQVWWAALIILAFSTPMLWLSIKTGKKTYEAGRNAEKFCRRADYLGEVLTGRDAIDERTLFGYGEEVNLRWREQYETGRVLQLKVTAKMYLITKGSSIILALTALLIALTLIKPVIIGLMTTGMFMGIVSAVFGMIQQVGWQMSDSLEGISKAGEYMKDLNAFIQLSSTDGAYVLPDREPPEFISLEFKNVQFRYPSGEKLILNGLSFKLDQGRHYAFVGRNGAGKTTITKLLTGLYDEYEGEIFINGKELRTYSAGSVKAMFSVVYQDFSRYCISLRDNIAIGDMAGVTESRVIETASLAGLDDTIAKLKDGMDTPLGKALEGGQDISGGQWQRTAIARSLISRAPVKILDEPTAALDPISESRVYSEFEKLMDGKTTIFISHRLGSTKLADEILVIQDGAVIERGTHDALMEIGGQYAEMFEAQRGWYQ